MEYLNVAAIGLRGRHHPALSNLITVHDVRLSRPHLKFLAGNYLTYGTRATQSGGSPHCRICPSDSEETVSHVISTCLGMENERKNLLCEYKQLCDLSKNRIDFDKICKSEKTLCQFVLDPTSLNLSSRVSPNDPLVNQFYRLSRDYCHLVDKTRIRLLKKKEMDLKSNN